MPIGSNGTPNVGRPCLQSRLAQAGRPTRGPERWVPGSGCGVGKARPGWCLDFSGRNSNDSGSEEKLEESGS